MPMTRYELCHMALVCDADTLVAAFRAGVGECAELYNDVDLTIGAKCSSEHDRLIDESIGLQAVPLRLDKRLLSKLQRIALDDGVNYLALIRSILAKEVAFLEAISVGSFRSQPKSGITSPWHGMKMMWDES